MPVLSSAILCVLTSGAAFLGGWLLRGAAQRREQAERDLLLAGKDEQFEFIFESVPVGISMYIQKRGQNRVWHINDTHLRITGIRREEIEADVDRILFRERTHPEDRDIQENQDRRLKSDEIEGFDMQKRYVHPDGKLVWVSFTSMRRVLSNGDEVFLHTVKDVSDLKKQEAELRIAKESAEQANRSKDRFLATMSHEMRTPVAAIIGFTDLLRSTPLDETQRDYVGTIAECGDSVLRLIGDILDLSKIEAGRMELEVAEFSIRDCVRVSVDILRGQAHAKGVRLEWCVGVDVPATMRSDASRLKQVLVNLLSNAVKFTEKGQVSLDVFLDADREGAPICFVVRDTGIGIPSDVLPGLFEAYSQGDASISRRFGGTGLGLAIVKSITGLLGGTVEAESVAGAGSAFTVRLPAAPPASRGAERA